MVMLIRFPMSEFKTTEKRAESKDLWKCDGWLLVHGTLGSTAASS